MISCILLCAGLSERFPSIKALAKINGEYIIERFQRNLLATNIGELIIVLGAHRDKIEPFIVKMPQIKVIFNENYSLGQTTSFQKGLLTISEESQGALLLPIDSPFVKGESIYALIEEFFKKQPTILIPTFNSKKGHPPIFNKKIFSEIQSLPPDQGINSIIHKHGHDERTLELNDPGIIDTFNTPQEFQTLLTKYNLT